jgi:hypothetical protein
VLLLWLPERRSVLRRLLLHLTFRDDRTDR